MKFQNVQLNADGKAKHEGYTSPTEIDFMEESSKSPTAWIMTRGNAIHLPLYRDCKVVMLPQTFLPMPVSFAYQKNSSLALIVDHVFWKMQVTGSPEHRAIHEEMRVGVSPALVVGEIA